MVEVELEVLVGRDNERYDNFKAKTIQGTGVTFTMAVADACNRYNKWHYSYVMDIVEIITL